MASSGGSQRATSVVVLALLFIGLALVFGQVLKLRFSSGEIYPHYSSLRSDPLGTRALYQALGAMDDIVVGRNLRPLSRIEAIDADTTVLLLGIPRASLSRQVVAEDDALLKAVQEGARLVVAVNPGLVPRSGDQLEDDWWLQQRRFREARGADGAESPDRDKVSETSLVGVLGIEVVVPETFVRPDGGWEVEPASAGDDRSDAAPVVDGWPNWHSQCRLASMSPEWRLIAQVTAGGGPVVAERRFGKGSVVLASGTWFASNEALWESASSEFLLWLIGDRRRVVFDESIHGARQSTGIMQWLLRHRLQGVFLGVLVVVGLLAWRSGSSLVPKRASLDQGLNQSGAVTGETAESGLVRLLRRSVAPASLLRRCAELWRESDSPGVASGSRDAASAEKIETVLAEAPNAVDGYREIVELLARGRQKRG